MSNIPLADEMNRSRGYDNEFFNKMQAENAYKHEEDEQRESFIPKNIEPIHKPTVNYDE